MPESLFDKLQSAKSEEDVKDIYIRALGLKNVQRNLVDIQTEEIWFEAKHGSQISTYAMFTQLLHYVHTALKKGESIPPFLAVIDSRKAALMKTSDVLPLLKKNTIKWGKSASQYTKEALDEVSTHIGTYFVSFNIKTYGDEFIEAVKTAIAQGDIIRAQITPDNLKQVFDKWVEMIGREIANIDESHYALLFFADIMSDGTLATHENLPAELLHKNNEPVFMLNGRLYELGSKEGYRRFWSIYHRPPAQEYRNYLLERRDSLIAIDERAFRGAFYTPLHVVDKAYQLLNNTLGKNWQKNYIVWDMCCGVGNLEVKHSNHRNIYMSTLDKADIDVMTATKTCVAATRFQYDYLNDDITDDGEIDYSLTNKMPQKLRDAIKEGKKILVLINPPYAEAGNGIQQKGKATVSKTRVSETLMGDYSQARNELFVQFLVRIATEIPNATLAMFSTLKYVNASNFEKFRALWKAEFLDGFITHSKAFDGLKGNFPIGFLIWKTDNNSKALKFPNKIALEIIDKTGNNIGEKTFYNLPKDTYLNVWLKRLAPENFTVIPLKNAVSPYTASKAYTKWRSDALGYIWCKSNDLQNSNTQTVLFSSPYGDAHGFFVNSQNLWQSAVIFTVRRLIKKTWINDRDQFLQPTYHLTDAFKHDCLIWMLFNGSNLTASANGLEWNDKTWSIVNHFIPFSEEEVNAADRFESDFMVQYLSELQLSNEATAVMTAGKALWCAYFDHTPPYNVREELKLNRPDVGWYQIRNALKKRNEEGTHPPVDFTEFETAYKQLGNKLRPQVFNLGFLKP